MYHIQLISVIHNDKYYSKEYVDYLTDIDNNDQFDLYVVAFESDINDGNVRVLENNSKQVRYQDKDDRIFQSYVNDIDKFLLMMNIHIIVNENIFDNILNQ